MNEGENFQHYQVLRRADGSLWELGRGAMGVTFKAADTRLHCAVALKVIRAESLHNERTKQRFVREARAAAGLSHPNVARVFHLGESDRSYFYAMEFIDGETLEACVQRQGPLPTRLALRIALQVANALRAASREGLIHRDIKPSNIMLLREEEDHADDVHVKVIDFGLAKVVRRRDNDAEDGHDTLTQAGFAGTPHYASPEQLDEKDLDVRSDIYSLGVTLWYMLAGRPPFGGSVVQIMSQHLTRTPPFETLDGVPGSVLPLLRRLLAKDPAGRPQNAGELRREIEEALANCADLRERSTSPRRDLRREVSPAGVERPAMPRQRGAVWHLATWVLLLLGFVVIAGFVALSAWYVLGPDADLPIKPKATERRQASPSPVPGRMP